MDTGWNIWIIACLVVDCIAESTSNNDTFGTILADSNPKPTCFNLSRSLEALESGDSLCVGESLWSPRRNVQLRMEQDGNLLVYRQCDGKPIWQSRTNYNRNAPQSVVMQEDGNLVLYDLVGDPEWASGTTGNRFFSARLRLEDTGSLCIENTTGTCLWRSGGFALCNPEHAPLFDDAQVILKPGDLLERNGEAFSRKKSCKLTLETNGTLVVYRVCDNKAIFSVRHGRANPERMDIGLVSGFAITHWGDLIFTLPNRTSVAFKNLTDLSSHGRVSPSSADVRLRDDDCQMCVFKDGVCLWTAHAFTNDDACPRSLTTSAPDSSATTMSATTMSATTMSATTTVPSTKGPRSLQVLGPGDNLGIGESIWSPNRTAKLLMQADGNLVVYRQCDRQAIWSSGTNSDNSRVQPVRMQADGNLVIYDIDDHVLWASVTYGKRFAGARLRLEDTGSLCIEQNRGLCLWRSGGIALCHPAYAPNFKDAQVILRSGESLTPGQSVWSNSGSCTLTLQTDGEMLLNRQCDGATIFSIRRNLDNPESMGADKSLSTFTMNETGNLQVTYVGESPVIFKDIQSRSFGNLTTLSADLRWSDDCQLCVFKGVFVYGMAML
ncbi:hypothetical protein BV898_18956 [Hypsibius exemplaris]|uniref:Bulb-type lectin domain-containing protein n=1 Tax=Hypsibius exemplaris TaxID=2072580 RepID=A0A9X6NKU5_HYPEX|nr:hypothetical protein BV898_18956 [Hypsibius exemplaris]